MQEQKEYQIEKVNHSKIYIVNTCFVIDYYKNGTLCQVNFCNEDYAREQKVKQSVGMWRIKQQKLNH